MPLEVRIVPDACTILEPTSEWQNVHVPGGVTASSIEADRDYYVRMKTVNGDAREASADCGAGSAAAAD